MQRKSVRISSREFAQVRLAPVVNVGFHGLERRMHALTRFWSDFPRRRGISDDIFWAVYRNFTSLSQRRSCGQKEHVGDDPQRDSQRCASNTRGARCRTIYVSNPCGLRLDFGHQNMFQSVPSIIEILRTCYNSC